MDTLAKIPKPRKLDLAAPTSTDVRVDAPQWMWTESLLEPRQRHGAAPRSAAARRSRGAAAGAAQPGAQRPRRDRRDEPAGQVWIEIEHRMRGLPDTDAVAITVRDN